MRLESYAGVRVRRRVRMRMYHPQMISFHDGITMLTTGAVDVNVVFLSIYDLLISCVANHERISIANL